MSIAVVGHTALDDIVYKAGRSKMCAHGGAAIYGAVAASIWDDKVELITKVGNNYPTEYLNLIEEMGIDDKSIVTVDEEAIRNWILYDLDGSRSILWQNKDPRRYRLRMTPALKDIKKLKIDFDAVHLATMHPRYQYRIVEYLKPYGLTISLDTIYIQLINKESEELLLKMLPNITIFAPSEKEVQILVGDGPLEDNIKKILDLGPSIVVVKLGEKGSILMDQKGTILRCPIYPKTNIVDVTGAGDSFCGGFLAGYMKFGDLLKAQHCGTVAASLLIEGFGALHTKKDVLKEKAEVRLKELAKEN